MNYTEMQTWIEHSTHLRAMTSIILLDYIYIISIYLYIFSSYLILLI